MSEKNNCVKKITSRVEVNNNIPLKIYDTYDTDIWATFQLIENSEVTSVSVEVKAKKTHSINKIFYCKKCNQFEISLLEGGSFNHPVPQTFTQGEFTLSDVGTQVVIAFFKPSEAVGFECFEESMIQPGVKRGLILID